jgi:hypothetical protein
MAGPAFEPGQPSGPVTLFTGTPAATAALPPGVVERLETIRELADAAHRQMPLIDERQEVNGARGDAERRLARLLAHPHQAGFNLPETDVRVIQQRRVLDEATIAAQRINDRYARAAAEWEPKARTLSACQTWLKTLPPGVTVTDWVGPEPKLAKGEPDVFAAIAHLERRTRELGADLHRVESAPYPSSHAKQRMREQIETLAQRGAPSMALLVEHDREIVWPQTSLRSAVYNAQAPSFAATETTDVFAVFAWLQKDTLIGRLDAEIDAEADDPNALDHSERQTQAAQTSGDLLTVSRDLSWWIWRGISQRLPVWFPDGTNPAAILAAELITLPTGNGGGSSPEHASYSLIGGRR